MKFIFFNKLNILKKRYLEIEEKISSKDTLNNKNILKDLLKERSDLIYLVQNFDKWSCIRDNIKQLEMLLVDRDLKELVIEEIELEKKRMRLIENKLVSFLSKDKFNKNGKSCFLEIRAGTGGHEASIFAKDLFKMYSKYAELMGWIVEIISLSEDKFGGYKEIVSRISGRYVYSKLKFESGGHRVQRVPKTESQGRVHTSTCTVAVLIEVPESKFSKVKFSDLRIDTFRSSGAGGQHVNTTNSAIRITHIPSGIVVECQDERSQHKNKSKALSLLNSKLYDLESKKKHQIESLKRKTLLGSGDRSDRIRTYNFHQNRVTDHRLNLTFHSLDKIMKGDLRELIKSISVL